MEDEITKESAEEKVTRIIEESYFGNNIENLARVRMLKCSAVKDKKTTIATYGIATCIGLAIVATDKNGEIHRIVMHHPYTGERGFEDAIEEYLKSLEPITNLKAMICSMKTFTDFDNLDDYEKEILDKINNIFSFYKKEHKNFNIPFHKSWYVKISPEGNFDYADSEMIKVYERLEKEQEEKYKQMNDEEER